MAKRFFTADWHLGMEASLAYDKRGAQFGGPFKTVDEMNDALISNAFSKTTPNDTIIHAGDLACFKSDRGRKGLDVNPMELVKQIPATFVNVHGNHDDSNRVKSICDSMHVHLGVRYPNVFVCHFPSYDRRAEGKFIDGSIMVCGHVHGKWKHCLDLDHSVLNINVGVDVWNYQIVDEDTLIKYIDKVVAMPMNAIYKVKKNKEGKIKNV